MSELKNLFDRLAAPFPPAEISWRVGSTNADKTKGLALAYVDARTVMRRFDDTIGPQNWQCRYPFAGCCEISLFLDPHGWVTKSNCAGETDIEGIKGQASDAFKRTGVLWGPSRYLYELPSVWVAIEPYGKSFRITDSAQADLMQRLAVWQAKRFEEQHE